MKSVTIPFPAVTKTGSGSLTDKYMNPAAGQE